jgi:NAD(P)H-quinone oxidoreductase subunit 5
MTLEDFLLILGAVTVLAPAFLMACLGLPGLLGLKLSEKRISFLTSISVLAGVVSATAILACMLFTGIRLVELNVGNWSVIPEEHFHFTVKFVFDRLSIPFVMMSFVLCGTIGAFARNYMHRDPGFSRFFTFYSFFMLGMVVASTAGTIETLFAGWELVGLSSALLVAFFHERQAPVTNGLVVWSIYRLSDAALLVAAVALHHASGQGDFAALVGERPWPDGTAALTSTQSMWVGLLILLAAAGKSAQIPFSNWLPRAMEGPTPSSAVFYGALSVHLGAFLLLRISPILEQSLLLRVSVGVVGLSTAIYASITDRVQTDVKSALAYASLTQVGIIFFEIACGFYYFALIHIIGHAFLRTLQLVRAPSLLRDYAILENAIGRDLAEVGTGQDAWLPPNLKNRIFVFALYRGYLDDGINRFVILPFLSIFRMCDSWERAWTDWLGGVASRESDEVIHHSSSIEEFQ